MRVFDDLTQSKNIDDLGIFESLPEKAKELFFISLHEINDKYKNKMTQFIELRKDNYDACKSPIEKILLLSFNIVSILREEDMHNFSVDMHPQYEINISKNKYYADFLVRADMFENDVSFVVECDGYAFHQKTKQQVKCDNEREYNIKLAGYDVLRFSGTQIYEDSFKCANDIVDYMIQKIELELKSHKYF